MPCFRCGRFGAGPLWACGVAGTDLMVEQGALDRCALVRCLFGGESRCHSEGSGNGRCKACLFGILPGWSGWDAACSYAGCSHRAVAMGLPGGKRFACREHAEKILRRRGRSGVARA